MLRGIVLESFQGTGQRGLSHGSDRMSRARPRAPVQPIGEWMITSRCDQVWCKALARPSPGASVREVKLCQNGCRQRTPRDRSPRTPAAVKRRQALLAVGGGDP